LKAPPKKEMPLHIDIDRMTLAEKLQTMETLWDDLCRRETDVPARAWQKSVLDERERIVAHCEARFSNWKAARNRLSKKMS
jgi:hypothetical protein